MTVSTWFGSYFFVGSLAGAIIFSLYIIFDTWKVV